MRADRILMDLRGALRDGHDRYPNDPDKAALHAWGKVHLALAHNKHGDCHEAEIEKVQAEYRRTFHVEDRS